MPSVATNVSSLSASAKFMLLRMAGVSPSIRGSRSPCRYARGTRASLLVEERVCVLVRPDDGTRRPEFNRVCHVPERRAYTQSRIGEQRARPVETSAVGKIASTNSDNDGDARQDERISGQAGQANRESAESSVILRIRAMSS